MSLVNQHNFRFLVKYPQNSTCLSSKRSRATFLTEFHEKGIARGVDCQYGDVLLGKTENDAVPGGCLQFVIVVFPDHNHLLL